MKVTLALPSPLSLNNPVQRSRGCLVWLLLISAAVWAKPAVPVDDLTVLERVPSATSARQLEPLRQKLAVNPADLSTALLLAEGYLTIGRATADPRFTSYAQATIAPWLRQSDPLPAVLVLAATVLQSSHQFAHALQLLDRAVAIDPRNGQAWLTMATVLQVQGKYAQARKACGNLVRSAGQVIALSCFAGVDSLNGRLEQSYRSLLGLTALPDASAGELRSWIFGQLGEMAVRLGKARAAEEHFLTALQAAPGDVYLKSAYADLLLAQQRDEEVLVLLRDNEQQDVLLLRLAVAGKRLASSNAGRWSETFAARYRAAQRGGDTSHLREYARFLLDVHGDAVAALAVAKQNWQVQREPADVQVFLNAAHASRQSGAAAEVVAWIRDNGYEDRTLTLPAAARRLAS